MKTRSVFASVVLLLFVSAFIVSCSPTQESSAPKQEVSKQGGLVLTSYGPTDIKAGKIFNNQPNGESAIWSKTENVTKTTVIVINGVELLAVSPNPDGKSITGQVPRELYAKAGEFPIYLLDKKTNEKSNELKFVVKP